MTWLNSEVKITDAEGKEGDELNIKNMILPLKLKNVLLWTPGEITSSDGSYSATFTVEENIKAFNTTDWGDPNRLIINDNHAGVQYAISPDNEVVRFNTGSIPMRGILGEIDKQDDTPAVWMTSDGRLFADILITDEHTARVILLNRDSKRNNVRVGFSPEIRTVDGSPLVDGGYATNFQFTGFAITTNPMNRRTYINANDTALSFRDYSDSVVNDNNLNLNNKDENKMEDKEVNEKEEVNVIGKEDINELRNTLLEEINSIKEDLVNVKGSEKVEATASESEASKSGTEDIKQLLEEVVESRISPVISKVEELNSKVEETVNKKDIITPNIEDKPVNKTEDYVNEETKTVKYEGGYNEQMKKLFEETDTGKLLAFLANKDIDRISI